MHLLSKNCKSIAIILINVFIIMYAYDIDFDQMLQFKFKVFYEVCVLDW